MWYDRVLRSAVLQGDFFFLTMTFYQPLLQYITTGRPGEFVPSVETQAFLSSADGKQVLSIFAYLSASDPLNRSSSNPPIFACIMDALRCSSVRAKLQSQKLDCLETPTLHAFNRALLDSYHVSGGLPLSEHVLDTLSPELLDETHWKLSFLIELMKKGSQCDTGGSTCASSPAAVSSPSSAAAPAIVVDATQPADPTGQERERANGSECAHIETNSCVSNRISPIANDAVRAIHTDTAQDFKGHHVPGPNVEHGALPVQVLSSVAISLAAAGLGRQGPLSSSEGPQTAMRDTSAHVPSNTPSNRSMRHHRLRGSSGRTCSSRDCTSFVGGNYMYCYGCRLTYKQSTPPKPERKLCASDSCEKAVGQDYSYCYRCRSAYKQAKLEACLEY